MTDKLLMNVSQVADSLSVSLATVRRWQKAGHLHPVQIGRGVRFVRDEVLELVDKLKAERT